MTERKLPVSHYSMMRRRTRDGKLLTTRRRIRLNYTRPSLFEGVSQVFDVGGNMSRRDTSYSYELLTGRNPDTVGLKEDAAAIQGDWIRVGRCIWDAMRHLKTEELTETRAVGSKE